MENMAKAWVACIALASASAAWSQTTVKEAEPDDVQAQDLTPYLAAGKVLTVQGSASSATDIDLYRMTLQPGQRVDLSFVGFNHDKTLAMYTWQWGIADDMPKFSGKLDPVNYYEDCRQMIVPDDPATDYVATACGFINVRYDDFGTTATAGMSHDVQPLFDVQAYDDAGVDMTGALSDNYVGPFLTDGVNAVHFRNLQAGFKNVTQVPHTFYVRIQQAAPVAGIIYRYPFNYQFTATAR